MPLTKYCKCGYPNLYTLDIPVFCAGCGTKLENSTATARQYKPPQVIKDDPQVEEYNTDIILPEKLEVEIGQSNSNKVTLGQLGLQPKTGFSRPIPRKVSKKKELEIFRAEASKSARRNVIEINDNNRD